MGHTRRGYGRSRSYHLSIRVDYPNDEDRARAGICRDYPRALLDQPAPELLPGCGYRAKTPGSRRMLAVLAEHPLTEEQRDRLKRHLRLE